jgi:hypothetical protein
LLALGASVGCSSATDAGAEGELVAHAEQPLLLIPGAFYTVAPSYGWCTSTQPNLSADCHPGYSSNSTGAVSTVTRLAVGRYQVFFPGLLPNGNVQLVGMGGNVHCNPLGTLSSPAGQTVDIVCRTPAGAVVDSRFVVSYYRDTNVGGVLGGYAQVRGTVPPLVTNPWNSAGGVVSATNTGVGMYRVVFPGQVLGSDTVQITATGPSPVHCKIGNWSNIGGAVAVDVRCFNFAGAPQNNDFSVSYGRNIRGEPRNTLPTGTQGAFSVVNPGGGVNLAFTRNTCAAGPNTANLFGTTYTERYHAITTFLGEVPTGGLVTALGSTGTYCNLAQVPLQGVQSDSTLLVNCFTPNGLAAAQSMHTGMVMLQDQGGC